MNHISVGKHGEALAVAYLRGIDYKIYRRNIRLGRDEIDIIAYDTIQRTLVFVEVKTRSRFDADFLPALGLTPRKKRALKRAAWKWMKDHEYDAPWRIDGIFVIGSKVFRHIRQMQ
ncbi:YraN family protein [Candidatus Peregrinibacteria bacterium CG10_big_fil_rev_8_21_14_0_10_42_8]|nr:MAG: YraN family protein [Candidatus Peregrinibacteria bacterium CG10_big_fil_rev_8_21_14_0_10_42_8]